MQFLIIFTILTILNVIIQTARSLLTVKGGKIVASLISAVSYGLYTYVVFFTASDGLNLHVKATITALANLLGVFLVKFVEEKKNANRIWKIECAIPKEQNEKALHYLEKNNISFNIMLAGDWNMFNCYSNNKKETEIIKELVKTVNGKISIYESKI